MESQDLLLFRNFSSINEPIMSTPFGYFSLRNLFIVGFFGMISFVLSKIIIPINASIQTDPFPFLITLIPFLIGLGISRINTPFGSGDMIILSFFYVMMKNNAKKQNVNKKKTKKSNKSKVLGFGKKIIPDTNKILEKIQEFNTSNLDDLKIMKFKIYHQSGEIFSDKVVKIYIDDMLLETIKTTLDGDVSVNIIPKTEGIKKLVIKTNDNNSILLEKQLNFKKI